MARLAQVTEISFDGIINSSNREVLLGTKFITSTRETKSSILGLTNVDFPITGVTITTGPFVVTGNFQTIIVPGEIFEVTGSTGNDGFFTVLTAVDNAGDTEITTVETVPSGVADGVITFKDIIITSNENNSIVKRKVSETIAVITTRVNVANTSNSINIISESILSIEGMIPNTSGVFPFTQTIATKDILSVYDSKLNPGSDSSMNVFNKLAKIPTIYEVDDDLATILAAANA